MTRRTYLVALAAAAGAITVPATVRAQPEPALASPTTSPPAPASPAVLVGPTSTTTTTTTSIVTAAPLVVAPPTTPAVLVAPATAPPTPTVPPVVAPPTVAPAPTVPAVIVAATTSVPEPDTTIGGIDPGGEIPDGFDLSAYPDGLPAPTPGVTGDLQLTAEPTCATQCIRSGVAYPRGFGALLVVETWVPAEIVLVVNADTDDDGSVDFAETLWSGDLVTEYRPALDHLTPGARYVVHVTATDEHLDTSHAYGEFTVLSQRTVEISVGAPQVSYGPTNVVDTDVWLRTADLGYSQLALPAEVTYHSLPRHLDLGLFVLRTWETSSATLCEWIDPDSAPPQGDDDDICAAWNTATADDVDLDRVLAASSWTEYSASTQLTSWDEGSLPGPPSDPRYFHVSADVSIHVEYS